MKNDLSVKVTKCQFFWLVKGGDKKSVLCGTLFKDDGLLLIRQGFLSEDCPLGQNVKLYFSHKCKMFLGCLLWEM